jgi:hypothetical protein
MLQRGRTWIHRVSVVAEAAKEQYPSNTRVIPEHATGRNHTGSMDDTLRPNHDKIQTVTPLKWFRRKRVVVYPQHTFVLGLSKHQTIIQSKMPL